MGWYHFKEWLEASSGLDMDALHVHAGLLIQLLAAWTARRSLRSPIPWLVVLVAVTANEFYDLGIDPWPEAERHSQWAESTKDMINTMVIPTVLLLLARCAPALLTDGPQPIGEVPDR
jgi:hypothetical protein